MCMQQVRDEGHRVSVEEAACSTKQAHLFSYHVHHIVIVIYNTHIDSRLGFAGVPWRHSR